MADHVHESWWLIESTYAPTRTLYYAGHRKVGTRLAPHMVDDPAKAVRWPDEWGAKYALAALRGVKVDTPMWPLEVMGYRVAEHIFDYTPPGVTACPTCNGNDRDAPCAYPSEGKPGCLRDARIAHGVMEKDRS